MVAFHPACSFLITYRHSNHVGWHPPSRIRFAKDWRGKPRDRGLIGPAGGGLRLGRCRPPLPPVEDVTDPLAASLRVWRLGTQYDDYVRGTKHGKGCEPSSLLVQIGSNRRLYVLAALLVLLGAGLDALRAHSASGLARHGTFDTSKLAVLLEPRTEPVLVPVLHNFLSNLPPAWPVQVHTSAATAAHLRTSAKLEAHLASGKLSLVLLPNDGRDVHNGETLSKYLAQDSAFWDLLAPAEQ